MKDPKMSNHHAMPSSDTQASNTLSHTDDKQPATVNHARRQRIDEKMNMTDAALSQLWLGIAAREKADDLVDIGFACHDGSYSIDFAVRTLGTAETTNGVDTSMSDATKQPPTNTARRAEAIADHLFYSLLDYQQTKGCKFLGAGLSQELVKLSPQISVLLWHGLDIVPMVLGEDVGGGVSNGHDVEAAIGVDELADSLARKCVINYGPSNEPRIQIGFRNLVEVDLGGRARIATLEEFQKTVTDRTWDSAIKYAHSLKQSGTKFAFFSATPQGGGVALMRHALIRFFRLLGLSCTWWVPKPKPDVFRVTKKNHNILQGVAPPDARLTEDEQQVIQQWVCYNADRFWTGSGGPLAPRSQGGVDVVILDDPQMPGIIDIAKKMDPDRPVIFRSHIQIRSDLAADPNTPTAGVWSWLWKSVQHADLFISHPVKQFVPHTVDQRALAYMPATTDWLDGLNKRLGDFEAAHYIHEINDECVRKGMTTLDYPKREYIAQIARFDPAKGIPHVLASYAEFRRASQYCRGKPVEQTPQLVLCGHGSVDDPDGVSVLKETLDLLSTTYADLKDSVVVLRLGPSDQLLNAVISNARVALQLSTREGFEIKVSEALHKGIPVIATTAGGIPLQVQHEKSGYLVEPGDATAVAGYLDLLFSDAAKYQAMSHYAARHVSDEVGTVGNAVCWMYLVNELSKKGKTFEPNGRWVWDMARSAQGEPKKDEGKDWLPRHRTT